MTLRLMSLDDKKITVLTKLFGGQGTIDVPSWSPDGKRLAFVELRTAAAEVKPARCVNQPRCARCKNLNGRQL